MSQGAPPVSTTPVANLPPVSTTPATKLPPVLTIPVANFYTIFASVVDTGGKFATGVNFFEAFKIRKSSYKKFLIPKKSK